MPEKVQKSISSIYSRVGKALREVDWKRQWPMLFVLIGTLLLVYVASEYATTYFEQRKLVREWERQQQQAAQKPAKSSTVGVVDDGLTRISIPKINLDAIVVEGTSYKKLKLGPGRMLETAQPGESGNSVITGHRDTFFRHIYELSKGDEILVQRNGKTFRYQVTGKKVVDPSDLSVTRPSKDKQLTLITCYPTYYIGPAPERLVVFSKLLEDEPAPSALATAAQGTQ